MAQFVQDGVVYEDLGNGNVRVVGYADAAPQGQPAPMTFGNPKPKEPEKPQNIQRKDGSIVQVYPDGRVVTVSGPTGAPSTTPTAPKLTAKERSDAIAQYIAADRVLRQQGVVQGLFNQSAGATDGFAGLLDLLPTPKNDRLNTAGQRLRADMKKLQGFTGGEGNTLGEASLLYDPFLVSSRNLDQTAQDKIDNMAEIAADARREAIMILGGVPDANGRITPLENLDNPLAWRDDQNDSQEAAPLAAGNIPPAGGNGPQGPDRSNPIPRGPVDPNFDPTGKLTLGTGRFATDRDKQVQQQLNAMLNSGATEEQLLQAVTGSGYAPYYNTGKIREVVQYRDRGGKGAGFALPTTGERSGFEKGVNTALTWEDPYIGFSPGTAAASGINALGAGTLEAIAPQAFDEMRANNPVSAFTGDVAGIVGATSAIGKIGAKVANRFAPQALTAGGRFGNVIRSVAPDAAYGAAYGGITEGDPLTGAVTAAAGSGAGQLLGKGAQKLFQGARLDPNAQVLRNAGMQNLTIGQSLGGFAKSLEDAGTSAPILGDIINARRAEGLQEFNLGRLNEAGAPIGATVTETGEDGLNQLMSQVGSAYDNATAGVNVPLDPQFAADMQAAAAAGRRLPPDYQVRFDKIGENRVGPIFDAGQMTGETYQQAMRGLKGARSSAGQAAPGFEQDYRDAVTLAMGALRGQMERGGGQNVIDGLAQADTANRLGKTLQNAMSAAKNDAGGAGVQIFTPAQLNTAAYAAQKKFPGPRPFADMTDAAQMVLPSKIPDSGTARRGASLLLPVSLGGTGAGLDYYLTQTPGEGGAAGLAAGALLLAGGSKGGQKALDKLLFKRPDAVRKVGGIFGRRKLQKGLGASVVTAPLLIEQ